MKKIAILGLAVVAPAAWSMTWTFDSLSAGPNAANAEAGLTINTVSIADAIAVNDVLAINPVASGFHVYSDPGTAWSGDNVAYAPGTDDLLIDFGSAMTSISVLSDRYPSDGSDVIRLIGLTNVNNTLTVGEVAEMFDANDGTVTIPENTLSLSGSYQYIILQSTTEQEGWDNLQAVPEPGTMAALGLGLAAIARRRRNK